MKILAALGPGDVVKAHQDQVRGLRIDVETSIVFSGQLFEYCREQQIEVLGISHNPRADSIIDGQIRAENRPRCLENTNGILFHLSRIIRAAYLAYRAARFGADLAIIDSGTAHYFALAIFAAVRIPVVVNFHNSLWPIGYPPAGMTKVIRTLDGLFFRFIAKAALGVSPECGRQVKQLARREIPYFDFRSQFTLEGFQRPIKKRDRSFRILFAGRVEENKGVFDLVSIAKRLENQNVIFDVCGSGTALPRLEQLVKEQGLADIITLHGKLARPDLLRIYADADALILPTRHDFSEGLPLVCAEAVLFGIPIVTSRLSNALDVLGPTIAEAEPEDIASFADAILRLSQDRGHYESLRQACPAVAAQFLDRSRSLPAVVDQLLKHLNSNWVPLQNYDRIFERLTA